ncbi:MAG TPA: hypothetical protein VK540_27340 [Polyangiaceae bacterium]|nr:hypothetical protein [Polyangiaceae bacterium]
MGLAEEAIDRGPEFAAVNLWVRGKRAARAAFCNIGNGLSPFPYMNILPKTSRKSAGEPSTGTT